MRRRDFIALLGSAAATWPLAARTQQPAMPGVGLLNPTPPDMQADRLRAVRQGVNVTSYVHGENVTITGGPRITDHRGARPPGAPQENSNLRPR